MRISFSMLLAPEMDIVIVSESSPTCQRSRVGAQAVAQLSKTMMVKVCS